MRNLFSILTLSLSAAYVNAADRIDFNHDIRPLLSNRCFACHGPDEEELKADLRLDTREGATKDLGGYAALVPGDPEASELLYRITLPADDDDVMPPKGKGALLPAGPPPIGPPPIGAPPIGAPPIGAPPIGAPP